MMTTDKSPVRVIKYIGGLYHLEVEGQLLLDGRGRVARIGKREVGAVIQALELGHTLREVGQ